MSTLAPDPVDNDDAMALALQAQPGRKRAETVHRLQIGLAGIGAMVLLIGLASVIMEGAQQTEANASSDPAAAGAGEGAAPIADPLAEAGVVPDMPAQGEQQQSAQEQAIVPERGNASPRQ